MMPQIATQLLTPRVVGVEFPFGHPFGMPRDTGTQRHVLLSALTVLAGAVGPGTRVDLDIEWPQSRREAYRAWQPAEPSPIVAQMLQAMAAPETKDDHSQQ
jgi:hypothetical protein